jgi:hypothetical protein
MRAGAQRALPGKSKLGMTNRVAARFDPLIHTEEILMNSIVYIVGLVVIVVAILSFFGLR